MTNITIGFLLGLAVVCVLNRESLPKPTNNVIFGVVLFLSAYAWTNGFNFHGKGLIHHNHEMVHYVIGTKYLREIGYFRQYEEVFRSLDVRNALPKNVKYVRDQHSYELFSRSDMGELLQSIRSPFSSDRLAEFSRDVGLFDKFMSNQRWAVFFSDKSFNASPAWALTASLVADNINITESSLTLAGSIDFCLLLVCFGFVYRTFGLASCLCAAALFAGSRLSPYSFIGGGLLRQDWLVAATCSVCFMKLRIWHLAGIFAAYACMVRGFPFIFYTPIVIAAIVSVCAYTRMRRRDISLACSGTLVILLLVAGSSLKYGSTIWYEWASKMSVHKKDIAPRRYGLDYVVMYEGEKVEKDLRIPSDRGVNWRIPFEEKKQQRLADFRALLLGFRLIVLLILIYIIATRQLHYYEMVGLGVCLIPLILSPTDYYYSMLVIPAITLQRISRHRLGALWFISLLSIVPLSHAMHSTKYILEWRQFYYSLYFVILALSALVTVTIAIPKRFWTKGFP